MNTAALRALIECAQQQELQQPRLAEQLAGSIDTLHPAIRLTGADTAGILGRFVHAYIEQVPDMLDAANQVAREAGIELQIKPVLKVAEEFFLEPPPVMVGHDGLDCLLDEAYLAHRLVEEVNDRYIAHLGQPLIPLDTTVANLIAHQLIGEEFANQLDEAVEQALNGLLDSETFDQASVHAYRERLNDPSVEAAWKRWPCLSSQFGVELELQQANILSVV